MPAVGNLMSGSSGALITSHARPFPVPFLVEVSLQVRPARLAFLYLRFSVLVILVDFIERSLQLAVTHHRRQDVTDDEPRHRGGARRALELIFAAAQRVFDHIPSCLYTFTTQA